MNKIFEIGNLTRDPELRSTQNGKSVCNFAIAVNEPYKKPDGSDMDPDYFEVEVWGKVAENCSKYLNKGSRVLIEGKLKNNNYEKDGVKIYRMKIIAQSVEFLTSGTYSHSGVQSAPNESQMQEVEEDMPF